MSLSKFHLSSVALAALMVSASFALGHAQDATKDADKTNQGGTRQIVVEDNKNAAPASNSKIRVIAPGAPEVANQQNAANPAPAATSEPAPQANQAAPAPAPEAAPPAKKEAAAPVKEEKEALPPPVSSTKKKVVKKPPPRHRNREVVEYEDDTVEYVAPRRRYYAPDYYEPPRYYAPRYRYYGYGGGFYYRY